jgi:hypothetical protein
VGGRHHPGGWLRVGEVQAYTGAMPAEVVHRLQDGEGRPGAHTPVALFGPSLDESCGGKYPIDDEADTALENRTGKTTVMPTERATCLRRTSPDALHAHSSPQSSCRLRGVVGAHPTGW